MAAKGTNQVAHLRQLAGQYRASFTREIVQCETMIDSLNLLNGDIQRGKQFGTEGYIADKHFACLRKLHVFPGLKPRERDKFNSALNYGYGILYNEVRRARFYVGLHPLYGAWGCTTPNATGLLYHPSNRLSLIRLLQHGPACSTAAEAAPLQLVVI